LANFRLEVVRREVVDAKRIATSGPWLQRETSAFRRGYFAALAGRPVPLTIDSLIAKRRDDFLRGYAHGEKKRITSTREGITPRT
jgi:hypothetical protein